MIGKKLKFQRNQAKLTLKELSERTGLSIGYLSNIERDLTSPTLDNLQLICNSMSIDMITVISGANSFNPCIRKNERKVMFGTDSRIHYQMLTGENLKLRGFCQILPAGYDDAVTSWGHEMDECAVVIEGTLHIEIDGVPYVLEPAIPSIFSLIPFINSNGYPKRIALSTGSGTIPSTAGQLSSTENRRQYRGQNLLSSPNRQNQSFHIT